MDDYNSFERDNNLSADARQNDQNYSDKDRTVAALFSSEDAAKDAKQALEDAGFDHVDLTRNTDATTADPVAAHEHGFWHSVKTFFGGDDDAHLYGEGVRRGNSLVTVHTSAARIDDAIKVLDGFNPIDLEDSEETWRKEGWGRDASAERFSDSRGEDSLSGAADRDYARDSGRTEDVIPVAEEKLVVAKRDVEGGNVRVRSYVREVPVSEQVRLRQENVSVERRPVDGRETRADANGVFQDRTIEATERNEEAVVGKTARVTEEVVVRKEVGERTETVNDTVRKTEVEVNDDRDPTFNRDQAFNRDQSR